MKNRSRLQLIWNLPRLIKTSWALLQNPQVSGQTKSILVLVGLGYLFFPLDLITDFIPILGQFDDLGVIFLLLNWFVNRSVPTDDLEAEYYISDQEKSKKK